MTGSFEQLARRIDPQGRLLRSWTLTGGISAQVTAMEVARADGQAQKMIVRRHGDADFENNPRVAADEFKLLQILRGAGVAVPAPIFVEETGKIFGRPVIVVEFIEGTTEVAPANMDDYMLQTAAHLAKIHRVDTTPLGFLPPHTFDVLPEKPDEPLIQAILSATPHGNRHGLLHGDYWPGNVLWRDGQLAAVIDWEDAALGDPLLDVANARLEILWALGIDAMHRFTRQYQAANAIDFSGLPYWDLRVALRNASRIGGWGLDAAAEKKMRDEICWFIGQAVM